MRMMSGPAMRRFAPSPAIWAQSASMKASKRGKSKSPGDGGAGWSRAQKSHEGVGVGKEVCYSYFDVVN